LGDNNRAIVLNISQNGLALRTATKFIDDELNKIRFQFSPSLSWVDASGRVAWRSESKKEAGIEFIGLSGEARDQIQAWISWMSGTIGFPRTNVSFEKAEHIGARTDSTETKSTIPVLVPELVDLIPENRSEDSILTKLRFPAEAQDAQTTLENARDENIAGDFANALRRVGLLVVAALLLSAFFLPGYRWQKIWRSQKGREMTAAPKPVALSFESSAILAANPEPSVGLPSFVLQVAAMVHEENADAFAESLRQRNFPAFVYKCPTDRFHLVVVGPYNSMDTALRAKNELEKWGFKAIRTEWKPQVQ
jgi:hypothetical protein